MSSVTSQTGSLHWLGTPNNDKKPLLLFLHGFPDSPALWKHQIDYFSEHFQVVCPFLGGTYGDSPLPTSRMRSRSIALELTSLLKALDPSEERPLFIVGHDLGVPYAWTLAQTLSGRLTGLIILNGLSLRQMAHRLNSPNQLLRSYYMLFFQIPWLSEKVLTSWPGGLIPFAYRLGDLPREHQIGETLTTTALLNSMHQYRALLRELPQTFFSKPLRLTSPVLAIFGNEDPFLYPPSFDELTLEASQLTIRILEGKHWLHVKEHEKINSILGGFIHDQLFKLRQTDRSMGLSPRISSAATESLPLATTTT